MGLQLDLLTFLYMSTWFAVSCSIAILNKFVFSTLEFAFPLSLTAYHMLGQSLLAPLVLHICPSLRKQSLSKNEFKALVVPVACILSVEICFNNLGLRYIPVSFVQTIRSLTPLCAALVSTLFLGKRLSRNAALTLIPICLGVSVSTYEELSFHTGGFIATLASCFLTAGKLALTSVLLGDTVNLDPMSALSYMSPVGFVIVFPVAVFFEGRGVVAWAATRSIFHFDVKVVLMSVFMALLLNLSIFLLLQRTNAVAVAVAGNLKVVVTIVLSVFMFGNPVTHLGALGCATAMIGCTSYGLVQQKFVAEAVA